MDSMDLKGIAWVGNVYQKFEAMCLEVEETMYEETAKYVENQVQTMGATVKRFYSDVMHDLHPPSSIENVKVDVGGLKKPKENIKDHGKKNVQVKVLPEKNSSPPHERLFLFNEIPKHDSVESSVRKGLEANETCGDCRLIYQVGSHSSGDMQHGQLTNEEVYMSHTGDGNVGKMENDETRDLRMEANGEDPMSKLEETCVLVIEENVNFESSNPRKNKSYKKKIREAFSLKMKSGRKQEYEQLAAQHVSNITRLNQEKVETENPTLAMKSNSKNSQAHGFSESESEWELL